MQASLEQCPLCGSELSQTKFREIRAKLREQDERKTAELAEARLALTRELDEDYKRKLEQERRTLEKRARDDAEKKFQKVTAERDALSGKLKSAEARETEIRKQAEENAKKESQKQLAEQRAALEADKDKTLLQTRAQYNRERESWQKKIMVLEHQLQKKTANELGDGGEIDVFEALRDEFQGDKVTRIRKGQPGADILHEILYKGDVCGRIVTDSKNRQGWQDAYVTKLRQDKVDAEAEHAILATTVFPAGKKELCVRSDVIVVSPARVVVITRLLRQAMIAMHVKGLSLKERSTKMNQLYGLITSQAYAKKFTEAGKLTQDILDLDVQEKRDHDLVWRKRGALATRMKGVLREIDTDVAAIVERTDAAEEPPIGAQVGKPASLLPSNFVDEAEQQPGR